MNAVSDIAFFVLLVRQGSLTAAAQELGVTTSAVSRRLSLLEGRLGIRLLNRTTRRISVTHEGEIYLAEGQRILEVLEELEQTVSGGQALPRGLLRVNASFGFGRKWIAPIIADFIEKYPEVEVQLHLSDRPVNLIEDGFDICIRFGELPDARVTVQKIAVNRRLLCAAPDYLERHGIPKTPNDLQRHPCIVIRENDAAYGTWHLRQGTQQELVKVRGAVSTNDGEVAVDWALRGHGILMRSSWHIADYIKSGKLIEVLPEWELPLADIHAVFSMKANLSAKVRAFIDHLAESLQADAGFR